MSPLITPVHNPHMVIHTPNSSPDITFKFEAHFDELMQSLLPNSVYYLSPGMPQDIITDFTFDVTKVDVP